MKILVLSQLWYPENGVPQRRWSWLSKILTDAGGHEVVVITPPPMQEQASSFKDYARQRRRASHHNSLHGERGIGGELIIRSGYFPNGDSLTAKIAHQAAGALSTVWTVFRYRQCLRDVDLIIGTVPALPTAALAAVIARYMKVPFVIDLRDAWPDLLAYADKWNKSLGKTSLRERVLRKGPLPAVVSMTRQVLSTVLDKADGIIVTSENFRERLLDTLEDKSTPRNVLTIRNVFPPESHDTEAIAPAEKQRGLHVLYAGTLGRAQNLENALKAAALVRNAGYDIHLTFVGAGAAKKRLHEIARQEGIEAEFLRRRPADSLNDLYSWADTALVHLTDWEPLEWTVPSKTYELMEVGVHISGVVSGEGGHLIEQLGAGHVVEPENPEALAALWIRLINNPSLLTPSDKGQRWVKRLREESVPDDVLSFLNRVVA
ncbi:glycosyltransferase family 4 protein [Corynebacterium zhongnanshanii]|uniref:Glycosyltransferase family 4 protein n=1 Tax=Corynebacterium zhongnanshanii TaxID=2768834 RepID=A0ABQ6VCJ7_9CORY|nr:glycosyltransferase family 4 protein [Corynebacterium zhongnanshanii]